MIKVNLNKIKSSNIREEKRYVSLKDKEKLNNHKGCILWFTGLSGSGKSTLAKALELKLHKRGVRSAVLDGDNLRHGLNSDLGFSQKDRFENIRRAGEVAKLMSDAGLIAISAFISPYEKSRTEIRNKAKDRYIEIFLDCPLEVCKKRDPKGLYKKALRNEIKNFTGICAPYEKPSNPHLKIDTSKMSEKECVDHIINYLEKKKII